jgi:hypothetical protein
LIPPFPPFPESPETVDIHLIVEGVHLLRRNAA